MAGDRRIEGLIDVFVQPCQVSWLNMSRSLTGSHICSRGALIIPSIRLISFNNTNTF